MTETRSAHLLTEPWLRRIMDAARAPACYAHSHEGESVERHVARAIASALTYNDEELRANGLWPAIPSESAYAKPLRIREGALSPLSTPSSPPAKPHLTPLDEDGIELERETRLGPGAPIAGEPTGYDPFERAETPEKPPLWDPADIVYHNRPPWADLPMLTIATAIVAGIAFVLALAALLYG